jgi:leader peptidase (prepilin peptidase)/N-methyltransferase
VPLQAAAVVVACVFGAVVGSFLNVCIFRLPQRESIVWPGSYCYSCGAELRALDLVPILSYLFLRGRCRHCGHRFSAQYPFVEALTAALFGLAVYIFWEHWLEALLVIIAGSSLLVILFVDLKHYIIPDELSAIVWMTGLAHDALMLATGGWGLVQFREVFGGAEVTMALPRSLLGTVVGAGLFYGLMWLFDRLFGRETMGAGDIKLAGAVGAWFGPGYEFVAFFLIAVIAGALIGVILRALHLKGRWAYIPFGPMMAGSALVLMLWGDPVTAFVIRIYNPTVFAALS